MAHIGLTIENAPEGIGPANVMAKVSDSGRAFGGKHIHDVTVEALTREDVENIKEMFQWSQENDKPMSYQVYGDGLDLKGMATASLGAVEEVNAGYRMIFTLTIQA